jgi:hypothetical protein
MTIYAELTIYVRRAIGDAAHIGLGQWGKGTTGGAILNDECACRCPDLPLLSPQIPHPVSVSLKSVSAYFHTITRALRDVGYRRYIYIYLATQLHREIFGRILIEHRTFAPALKFINFCSIMRH